MFQTTRFLALTIVVGVAIAGCTAPPLSHPTSVATDVAARTGSAPAWGDASAPRTPTPQLLRDNSALAMPSPLSEAAAVGMTLDASPDVARLFAATAAMRAEALNDATPMNPALNFTSAVPLSAGAVVPVFAMLMVQIDELWKQPVRSDIARDTYEAALLALSAELVALATDARLKWHEVALRTEEVASASRAASTSAQLLLWEEERFSVGEADAESVAKARMAYALAHHRGELAAQALEESRLALMGLVGRADAANTWALGDPDASSQHALHGAIDSERALTDRLAESRLDVRAANARVKAAASRVLMAQRSRIGKFEIGAGWERSMEDMSGAGFAALVEVPLFNDGSHRVAKALADYDAAQIAAEKTRQTAVIELRVAYSKAHTRERMHDVGLEHAYSPTAEAVDRMRAALDSGEGSRRDLATAEREMHQAALDLNELERERRRARLDLVRTTGFLPAEVSQ